MDTVIEMKEVRLASQTSSSEASDIPAESEMNIRVVVRCRRQYLCHLVQLSAVQESGLSRREFLETQLYHSHKNPVMRFLAVLGRGWTTQTIAVRVATIVAVSRNPTGCCCSLVTE